MSTGFIATAANLLRQPGRTLQTDSSSRPAGTDLILVALATGLIRDVLYGLYY